MPASFQSLARFLASGLLSSLLFGSILALAAWAFLRLSGIRSSRARFAVWFSALLLIFILPWFSGISASPASPESRSSVTLPAFWAVAILWIWAIGASLALLRVGFAFYQSIRLRESSQAIEYEQFDGLAGSLSGNFRGAELRISDEVRTPTAIGFFRPLILIPSWALKELSDNELQAVLIHELEHLRRWDDWTNFAQKIVSALFFFHPAVWWMDRNLALEREIACDDAVLARTPDHHAYAACLVRVAEKSLLHKGLALAQAIIGRVGQTTLRITRILAGSRPPKYAWKPAAYILAASSLSGMLFLTQVPPLVSFESQPTQLASSTLSAGYAALASADDSAPAPRVVLARLSQPETPHAAPQKGTGSKATGLATNSKQKALPVPAVPVDLIQAELAEADLMQAQLIQARMFQSQMIEAHARFMQALLNESSAPNVFVIMQPGQSGPQVLIVWPAPALMRAQPINPARKI
jgi:beta-lactamase regulating signal transducer with metallopeptidase domain